MKNSAVFLSILIVCLFRSEADAGGGRDECRQMCSNLSGMEIAACYSKCRDSNDYYSNLKNNQNPNQAAAGEIDCGPNAISDGKSCVLKSSICSSFGGCDPSTFGSTNDSNNKGTSRWIDEGSDGLTGVGTQKAGPDGNTTSASTTEQSSPTAPGDTSSQQPDSPAQADNGSSGMSPNDGPQCAHGTNDNGSCKGVDNITAEDAMSCSDAAAAVENSCNTESRSWMGAINNVSGQIGGALMQINPSTCGAIAAAQTGATASIATLDTMCNSAMQKCTSLCTAPGDQTSLANCQKWGVKKQQVQQDIAKAMQTFRGSITSCQNAYGSLNNQAQAYCATNPAACQTNLNLQTIAATTPDQAGGAQGGLNMPGLGGGGSGGNTGNKGNTMSLSDLMDDGAGIGEIKPAKPGEDPGGAKGGGRVGEIGGSVGGGGGPNGRATKSEGLLSNILSGFFGSGGGSGFGNTVRGWFGMSSGNNSSGTRVATNRGPDLRQFLPGGLKDPTRNRGIAGGFVGLDGMAGPHADIWKQVNNRYQYKRASLLP